MSPGPAFRRGVELFSSQIRSNRMKFVWPARVPCAAPSATRAAFNSPSVAVKARRISAVRRSAAIVHATAAAAAAAINASRMCERDSDTKFRRKVG